MNKTTFFLILILTSLIGPESHLLFDILKMIIIWVSVIVKQCNSTHDFRVTEQFFLAIVNDAGECGVKLIFDFSKIITTAIEQV